MRHHGALQETHSRSRTGSTSYRLLTPSPRDALRAYATTQTKLDVRRLQYTKLHTGQQQGGIKRVTGQPQPSPGSRSRARRRAAAAMPHARSPKAAIDRGSMLRQTRRSTAHTLARPAGGVGRSRPSSTEWRRGDYTCLSLGQMQSPSLRYTMVDRTRSTSDIYIYIYVKTRL